MKKRNVKKLIKGTQGAISILLACLMLPFFSIAAVLVEVGRYQSTINALDAAIGSSAYSTLSDYDSYVFERFGLLAASQSGDDANSDLTEKTSKYLDLQKTVDVRGAEVESVSVNGLNCLAEIEILKQQIQQYASVIGPTKLVIEGFDINSLISQIEKSLKITAIFEQLSSGFKLIDKEVAMLEAYEDAKKQMKEVQKAEKDYNEKFDSWVSAVGDLIDHLGTDCPDSEEHPILYSNWQSKKSNLINDAESARSNYASSIGTLISAFETLQSNITAAVKAQGDFETQIVDFETNSINANIKLDSFDEEDKEVKAFAENMIEVEKSLNAGASSVNNKFSEHSKGFSAERITAAISSLINEKNAVNAYSTSGITASSSTPSHAAYHDTDLDGLTDSDAIDELMDETQSEIEDSGALDILLALVDILNTLFKLELVSDGKLNARLNTAYYYSEIGGLPSMAPKTPDYSFLSADEKRSKDYLAAIDPDFDENDPYGQYANSLQAKMDAVLDAIDTVRDKADAISDASWLIDKCKAVVAFGFSLIDLVGSIVKFVTSLVKELLNIGYERLLTFVYLAYNLPNRTNFSSGVSLSGYSFTKISRPTIDTGTNVPIIGDIYGAMTESEEYSFVGAELEYIMFGYISETVNQKKVFLAIYLLRMVTDMWQVLSNSEVLSIVDTLTAVPYVGPILGVGFGVLAGLSEPFFDTIFLVNGGKVNVVKSEIYLTPSGLPELIGGLTSLKLTPALKEKITNKACKAYKIEAEKSTIESKANAISAEKKTDTGDKKIIDTEKYLNGLTAFDYAEHCLFLMLILGNEGKYLLRLADLIQCEMTMYNHLDKATASQQITGEYKKFNIYHAYSTVRVNVTGTLTQMLPLPAMSNGSIFDRSFDRVIYRGY